MKKIIIGLILTLSFATLNANALETTVIGRGTAALSGYDIGATRAQEDAYMANKAYNSKTEFMHTQQIKEASRQAEKRKKEDKRLKGTLRTAIITTARQRADMNAVNQLLNDVLGPNAYKNPEVQAQIENIYSQIDSFAINKTYTGEIIDNNYVAKVTMVVDDSQFRELVSNQGIALNIQEQMTHSILVVMDEFFAAPSDMHSNVLTEDVTTYDYKYSEKDKEAEKSSSKASSSSKTAAGYSNAYSAAGKKNVSSFNANSNYGRFVDYSQNESVFFQNIKKYAPRNPQINNANYTLSALNQEFARLDITAIENSGFKKQFFKSKSINSDLLLDSVDYPKYIDFAQNNAGADFFAIGTSYIVDRGVDESTGKRAADCLVYLRVFSTQSHKIIASGTFSESASGNTADSARQNVAKKAGEELGQELAKQIQQYFKKVNMNGLVYSLEIRASLLPAEKARIYNAIKSISGIQSVKQKSDNGTKLEYSISYKGEEPVQYAILSKLTEIASKFNNYDARLYRDQIIVEPLKRTNK